MTNPALQPTPIQHPQTVHQPCASTDWGEGRPRPAHQHNVLPVLLIFASALITALLWRWWCVPYGDDYIYSHMFETDGLTRQSNNWLGHPITTLGDAWSSTCRHYLTGPGRLANSLSFFMALLPHWMVVALGALAVACQPLLAALVAGGRQALRRPTALGALYILMWLLLPWFDHMQSIVFLTNYVGSACAILLAMLIYDHLGATGPTRRQSPIVISCWLIVLLAAWMHEGFSVALIAWMAGRLITTKAIENSRKLSKILENSRYLWRQSRPQLLMLMSALVGFALSLSPGTWGRIGESTGAGIHIPVQDILLLAPVGVLALITLRRRLAKVLLPYWLGIAANLMVVIASHASGRALWPSILLSLTAIWHLIYLREPMRLRWLWMPLTALYIVMMVALIDAQTRVSQIHHRVHPLLSSAPIIYCDSASATLPWYALDIPLADKYNDRLNLHFELQAASSPAAMAVILPDSCRGLPWREWPKVPGDNPYRGTLAHMVTNDSVDTPTLRLHMGAPLPSMSPFKQLVTGTYHTIAPSAQLTVRPTLDRVCVLDGDTLYRVSLPPVPYLWSDRPIVSVDLIR